MKKNKENVSDYICRLVEADMNKKETTDTSLQDEVRKIVLETLIASNQSIIQLPVNNDISNEEKTRREDIDLLNQLF